MPGENIPDWSTAAATNATADSSINWAEGQTRASVNDSARSMMAAVAKDRNLKNGSITTGGTANAQTVTSGLSYTSVPTNLWIRVKIGATLTNTTSATLNMDGIGAVTIKNQAGSNLSAGDIVAGSYVEFLYNGTNWIKLPTNDANVGTWTPAVTFVTPGNLSVSYSVQSGSYTKIGRLIFATGAITTSSFTHTTASGEFRVTGLPFTSASRQYVGSSEFAGWTSAIATMVVPEVVTGSTQIRWVGVASAVGLNAMSNTTVPSGGTIAMVLSVVYEEA